MTQTENPGILAWGGCVFTGYVVCAIVGIPTMVLGILLDVPALKGSWRTMAHGFARSMLGMGDDQVPTAREQKRQEVVQSHQSPTSKPLKFWQHPFDQASVLTVVLQTGGEYTRFIRTHANGIVRRTDLTPIFPDELSVLGLAVSGESAVDYTLRQMAAGVIDGVAITRKSTAGAPPQQRKEPEKAPEQEVKPQQPAPTPQVTPKPAAFEKPKVSNSATGVLLFAGVTEVTAEGRKPYKSFTIIVEGKEGKQNFSGVDLQEKFSKGAFQVGDTVSVEKRSVNFTVELNGETKTRRKNEYDIQVLNSPK